MISNFLNSTMINSIGYDNFTLLVNFTNGTSYLYYNVPYELYEDFLNSKSPGKFYNEKVKGLFKSKKVF